MQRAINLTVGALLLVATLALSGCDFAKPKWEAYTANEAGFSASFFGKVKKEVETDPSPGGTITTYTYSTEPKSTDCVVVAVDLSELNIPPGVDVEATYVQGIKDELLNDPKLKNAEISGQRFVKAWGYNVSEARVKYKGGGLVMRVFLAEAIMLYR